MVRAGSPDPFGLVGTVVDRKYRVDRVVAEGGFGIVYAGRHLALDQAVAVKVLRRRPRTGDDEWQECVSRFVLEAQTLARLRHPGLVSVLDAGVLTLGETPLPWMVLEWLDGRTLAEDLQGRRGRGGRSLADALAIWRPIAAAVAEAHDARIAHRDLKPNNVMLVPDRKGAVSPLVLDFGIAKVMQDDERSTSGHTTTADSMRAFSPAYAAPEQISGTRTGPWSDVHALGLMLSELLVDAAPYGDDPTQAPARAFGSVRPTPASFGVDVGPLEAVLVRALALKPAERYPDARTLLAAVTEAVEAAPVDVADRDLATAGSTQGGSPSTLASTDASRSAPSRRRSLRAWTLLAAALVAILIPGIAFLRRGVERTPGVAPGPASVRPTTMIDLPAPRSSSAEAVAEYLQAMVLMRGASTMLANKRLDRALELDPLMAAAHLRRAIYVFDLENYPSARQHYVAATSQRASLSERDQAILDAFAPHFRLPTAEGLPDQSETEAALRALVDRHPGDAELAYLQLDMKTGKRPDEWEAVLAIDPRFALALWHRAYHEEDDGDPRAALSTLERCVDIAPDAQDCLASRSALRAVFGDCAGMESDARRRIDLGTPGLVPYIDIADALLAQGRSADVVRAAMSQAAAAASAVRRPRWEIEGQAAVDIATGDFTAASQHLVQAEKLGGSLVALPTFEAPGLLRVELALETGDVAEAGRLASRMLATRGVGNDEVDPRPFLLAVAGRAGLVSDATREAELAAWTDSMTKAIVDRDRWRIWVDRYAVPARTRADAEQALAHRAEFGKFSGFNRLFNDSPELEEARVRILAGDHAGAIPLLRYPSPRCMTLWAPFDRVRAYLYLGQALEATGDLHGACDAYAVVLARWGDARPRSVSANEARARRRSLSCGGPSSDPTLVGRTDPGGP